jgi:hypothetical protein
MNKIIKLAKALSGLGLNKYSDLVIKIAEENPPSEDELLDIRLSDDLYLLNDYPEES